MIHKIETGMFEEMILRPLYKDQLKTAEDKYNHIRSYK